jgi:hypothetical protein
VFLSRRWRLPWLPRLLQITCQPGAFWGSKEMPIMRREICSLGIVVHTFQPWRHNQLAVRLSVWVPVIPICLEP